MSKQPPFAEQAPLPWRAELFVDDVEQVFQGEVLPPEEPEWWLVDTSGNPFLLVENFAADESPESVEARAHLLAAAPELLEAAIHLLASLDHHVPELHDSPMRQMVRAAIAKAQPTPTDTQEARHKAAYAEAHADRECGPGCPWCEEADARAAIADASDDALEVVV